MPNVGLRSGYLRLFAMCRQIMPRSTRTGRRPTARN
jgi:hypothetical protein